MVALSILLAYFECFPWFPLKQFFSRNLNYRISISRNFSFTFSSFTTLNLRSYILKQIQADCREIKGTQAAIRKMGKSASEGRAVAPQAVEEKLEGSCTPVVCKNMWECCRAIFPQWVRENRSQRQQFNPSGLKMYQKWVRGKTNVGCTATSFFRQLLLATSC